MHDKSTQCSGRITCSACTTGLSEGKWLEGQGGTLDQANAAHAEPGHKGLCPNQATRYERCVHGEVSRCLFVVRPGAIQGTVPTRGTVHGALYVRSYITFTYLLSFTDQL